MEPHDLDERLENWRRCLRSGGLPPLLARSLESHWRSPQCWAFLDLAWRPRIIDPWDAWEIEGAVTALPAFYAVLLAGWYVRRWSPAKSLQTARKAAGEARTRRGGDFDASLAMAKCLLTEQLGIPAVVRKERIRARVRILLAA